MAVSYYVYDSFYTGPIIFLQCLPLLLLGTICVASCCYAKKSEDDMPFFFKYLQPWYIHNLMRNLFGNVFKEGKDDTKEDPQTIAFNFIVPTRYLYSLATLILQIFALSLGVFWEKFVFEVTFTCAPDIDCYDYSSRAITSSRSYINCSEEVTVSELRCFRVVLDWSTALGAAGGLLVLASITIAVLPWIILKVTNGKHASDSVRRKVLFVQVTLLLLLLVIVTTYALLLGYVVKKYSIAQIIELIGLSIVFTMSIFVPWWNFESVDELNDTDSQTNDGDLP